MIKGYSLSEKKSQFMYTRDIALLTRLSSPSELKWKKPRISIKHIKQIFSPYNIFSAYAEECVLWINKLQLTLF